MTCKDAMPLLKLRRDIASSKEFTVDVQRSLLDCIDLIRWSHDPSEDECCPCWVNARREAGSVAA